MQHSEQLQTTLRTTALGLTLGLLVATVLLVVPTTDNFLFQSKSFTTFFVTFALLLVFLGYAWVRKSFEFVISPFTVGILAFGLASIAATFFTQSYPVENLLNFGGIYIAGTLIALTAGSILPKNTARLAVSTLAVSSALLVVTQLAQAVGFGPAHLINQLLGLQLPTNLVFNLAGSPLVALELLIVTLLAMVVTVVSTKFIPKLYVVTAPILLIGLILNVWALLPGKTAPLSLPSFTASWSVALDTIRSPRAALIGSGPASYQNNYLQFKPLWVNGTNAWNIPFSQAADLPLTLIATTGFLGLVSWIFLNLKVFFVGKSISAEGRGALALFLVSSIIMLFVPANVALLTIQAVALAALIALHRDKYPVMTITPLKVNWHQKIANVVHTENKQSNLLFNISAMLLAVVLLYGTYLTGRAYAAHVQLFRSDLATAKDDAVAVYELQQSAYQLNPYLDVIRRRYATTNLLIAIALSNKTDITEPEKAQVGELLQQAIREARSATVLDPTDTQNWQILAQIYQNMIGVTEDAQEWTVQSYVQAIQLNPNDPVLRLNLGGVFMNAEQYDQAAGVFSQATQIKPDYPGSYYQLARALAQLNQLDQSKAAYQQVLALLPANTEEYTLVTKELEELEKIIAERGETETDAAAADEDDDAGTPLGQEAITTPSITDQALEGSANDVAPQNDVELNQPVAQPDQTPEPEATPAE